MGKYLRVEITDDTVEEGAVYVHQFPPEASLGVIADAIETLYPTVTALHMFITDDEDTS